MEKNKDHIEHVKLDVEKSIRPTYKLYDLVAEMPDGLPVISEWENMKPVGLEKLEP